MVATNSLWSSHDPPKVRSSKVIFLSVKLLARPLRGRKYGTDLDSNVEQSPTQRADFLQCSSANHTERWWLKNSFATEEFPFVVLRVLYCPKYDLDAEGTV